VIGGVDLAALSDRFLARFDVRPRVFQAPGRINIIGEHTDYCEGLAMPAAIDRRCIVAAAPNDLDALRIVALNTNKTARRDWRDLRPVGDWSDYVAGVWRELRLAGTPIAGADLMIDGDVPIGAGVSSSAALEVAVASALLAISGRSAESGAVARWCQSAENAFVGMPCGIMDQFASASGQAGCALLLDCRTVTANAIALPASAAFILVDSQARHALVSGEYAERRADCEAAAAALGVAALRDVDLDALRRGQSKLTPRQARRARHVVTEIERVRQAADALAREDLPGLGELMNRSHASLRDDMEVSVPEVDLLAEIAQETPGVHGARLMGGGFGGGIIALADAEAAPSALAAIQRACEARTGTSPPGFVCSAVGGAGEVAP
jgi:galactokinase